MRKKYQVFLSSTYTDLRSERQGAAVMLGKLGYFVMGMELFFSLDLEQQWARIMRDIEECDYYLMIIGDRYGSVCTNGCSFTEIEYHYALSLGKSVVALVRDRSWLGKLVFKEKNRDKCRKLQRFIAGLQCKRLYSWRSKKQLVAQVVAAMHWLEQNQPAKGWLRLELPAAFPSVPVSAQACPLRVFGISAQIVSLHQCCQRYHDLIIELEAGKILTGLFHVEAVAEITAYELADTVFEAAKAKLVNNLVADPATASDSLLYFSVDERDIRACRDWLLQKGYLAQSPGLGPILYLTEAGLALVGRKSS